MSDPLITIKVHLSTLIGIAIIGVIVISVVVAVLRKPHELLKLIKDKF